MDEKFKFLTTEKGRICRHLLLYVVVSKVCSLTLEMLHDIGKF